MNTPKKEHILKDEDYGLGFGQKNYGGPGAWVDRIPLRLRHALIRYRDQGIPTGGALRALLMNDLQGFVGYADSETFANVRHLFWWLHRFMPDEAYGTEDKVTAWMKLKGLQEVQTQDPEAYRSWKAKVQRELEELGREEE